MVDAVSLHSAMRLLLVNVPVPVSKAIQVMELRASLSTHACPIMVAVVNMLFVIPQDLVHVCAFANKISRGMARLALL
jgi:hypothetical protein